MECFESLSAIELAEQITLLDHIVFRSIPYEYVLIYCKTSQRVFETLQKYSEAVFCENNEMKNVNDMVEI